MLSAAGRGHGRCANCTDCTDCTDCTGIVCTLALRDDGLYRLPRTCLGRPGEPLLRSGIQRLTFALQDPSNLRLLDPQNQPTVSELNDTLRRTAAVESISAPLLWRGEVGQRADAADGAVAVTNIGSGSGSGLRWPVVRGADFPALARSDNQQRSTPHAPLLVVRHGRLVMLPDAGRPRPGRKPWQHPPSPWIPRSRHDLQTNLSDPDRAGLAGGGVFHGGAEVELLVR